MTFLAVTDSIYKLLFLGHMVSFLVWIAICGVISGVLLPAERKLAAGDDAAEATVERAGQIATLLLLVMLYLMIWKPGA